MSSTEISPDEDLVNEFRLAKGDLMVVVNGRGKISHAIPAGLTIMKDLVRRGVFPYHYEIYGVGFLELQSAFRTPLRAKCSSVLLEQWGVGVSAGRAAGLYIDICKGLGNRRVGMLEFVLENRERRNLRNAKLAEAIEERRKDFSDGVEQMAECFERLVEIMDAEKERVLNESKNNS